MIIVGLLANISNLDLFAVGISALAIGLLGFVTYISNDKSITVRAFLCFACATIAWNFTNFMQYHLVNINATLWMLRVNLFVSTWHAFAFLFLAYVFPDSDSNIPKWLKWGILPLAVFTSLLVLTPYVFVAIPLLAPVGQVTNPIRGPLLPVFVICVIGFLIAGLFLLFWKQYKFRKMSQKQSIVVFLGMTLTVFSIILFNVVLPIFFVHLNFLPYTGWFMFPFITLVGFAIFRYHLFNLKVIATEALIFLIGVITFVEVLFTTNALALVLRLAVLLLILVLGSMLTRSVVREVQQREQIEALASDLKQKNIDLVDLDHKRLEFLSFATHQLRAPLTSIRGLASMLIENGRTDISGDAKQWAGMIYASSTNMVQTVEDFLNTSRLDSGEIKYAFTQQDILPIVNETVRQYKPVAESKGLSFAYTVNGGTEAVMMADSEKVRHIVTNLVDNAIKYTATGWIKLIVTISDTNIEIRVDDSGMGLNHDLIGKLFQRWSRLGQKNEQTIKGTGLGLFIVKEMVTAHGGTVRAESAGEGKGSSFIAELPRNFVPPDSTPVQAGS